MSQIPFTPAASKVLLSARDEAVRLGDNYVGTEHLLLALLRTEGMGRAAARSLQVLESAHDIAHDPAESQ